METLASKRAAQPRTRLKAETAIALAAAPIILASGAAVIAAAAVATMIAIPLFYPVWQRPERVGCVVNEPTIGAKRYKPEFSEKDDLEIRRIADQLGVAPDTVKSMGMTLLEINLLIGQSRSNDPAERDAALRRLGMATAPDKKPDEVPFFFAFSSPIIFIAAVGTKLTLAQRLSLAFQRGWAALVIAPAPALSSLVGMHPTGYQSRYSLRAMATPDLSPLHPTAVSYFMPQPSSSSRRYHVEELDFSPVFGPRS
jgi:hypothetical protein